MPDQEVHEIQLNGKQLVFMFMAATVVSVVIFLCGVMVGRGVRQPQVEFLAATADPVVEPTPPLETSASPRPAGPAPAPANEALTFAEQLEAPVAPREPLKPAGRTPGEGGAPESKPAVAPAIAEKPAPKEIAKASATKQGAPAVEARFAEPAGRGFVVQVMAFPDRADADALAGRLTAQGYRTFVTTNDAAPKARYRVRIGKYPTKAEADAVSDRLKRQDFNPWVTR
jgi:cell division protein FtsN